ncbi:MAG: hypothetical protein Ct9H300mP30_0980 [Methanobacteriota archaeon]|nr:MAG: hypothetical protein Ct9H300mP30_0980 [Euryarchaeota archaeon]
MVKALKDICKGVDMLDPAIHDPFRGVITLFSSQALWSLGRHWVRAAAAPWACFAPQWASVGPVSAIEQAGWEIIEGDYDEEGMQVN